MTSTVDQALPFEARDGSPRRAFVRLPADGAPHRAALILPGLALPGPPPVKGYVTAIAERLAALGVAAIRCEPVYAMPGGTALGELDWHSEVDDGVATLRLLRQQPWVDLSQVFIVGLSLGGVAAPIVARRAGGVAGIFSWAATARPWATYALANLRHQLIWRGFPAETIARVAELSRHWSQALIDTDRDAAELLRHNPGLAELEISETGYLGRPTAFWRQLTRFDPVESYRGLSCRIGAVRGSCDFAAHPADLQAIVGAAEGAGLTVDVATLHGLDHLLRPAESAAQACRHGRGHGEPAYERLVQMVVAWIDGKPLDLVERPAKS